MTLSPYMIGHRVQVKQGRFFENFTEGDEGIIVDIDADVAIVRFDNRPEEEHRVSRRHLQICQGSSNRSASSPEDLRREVQFWNQTVDAVGYLSDSRNASPKPRGEARHLPVASLSGHASRRTPSSPSRSPRDVAVAAALAAPALSYSYRNSRTKAIRALGEDFDEHPDLPALLCSPDVSLENEPVARKSSPASRALDRHYTAAQWEMDMRSPREDAPSTAISRASPSRSSGKARTQGKKPRRSDGEGALEAARSPLRQNSDRLAAAEARFSRARQNSDRLAAAEARYSPSRQNSEAISALEARYSPSRQNSERIPALEPRHSPSRQNSEHISALEARYSPARQNSDRVAHSPSRSERVSPLQARYSPSRRSIDAMKGQGVQAVSRTKNSAPARVYATLPSFESKIDVVRDSSPPRLLSAAMSSSEPRSSSREPRALSPKETFNVQPKRHSAKEASRTGKLSPRESRRKHSRKLSPREEGENKRMSPEDAFREPRGGEVQADLVLSHRGMAKTLPFTPGSSEDARLTVPALDGSTGTQRRVASERDVGRADGTNVDSVRASPKLNHSQTAAEYPKRGEATIQGSGRNTPVWGDEVPSSQPRGEDLESAERSRIELLKQEVLVMSRLLSESEARAIKLQSTIDAQVNDPAPMVRSSEPSPVIRSSEPPSMVRSNGPSPMVRSSEPAPMVRSNGPAMVRSSEPASMGFSGGPPQWGESLSAGGQKARSSTIRPNWPTAKQSRLPSPTQEAVFSPVPTPGYNGSPCMKVLQGGSAPIATILSYHTSTVAAQQEEDSKTSALGARQPESMPTSVNLPLPDLRTPCAPRVSSVISARAEPDVFLARSAQLDQQIALKSVAQRDAAFSRKSSKFCEPALFDPPSLTATEAPAATTTSSSASSPPARHRGAEPCKELSPTRKLPRESQCAEQPNSAPAAQHAPSSYPSILSIGAPSLAGDSSPHRSSAQWIVREPTPERSSPEIQSVELTPPWQRYAAFRPSQINMENRVTSKPLLAPALVEPACASAVNGADARETPRDAVETPPRSDPGSPAVVTLTLSDAPPIKHDSVEREPSRERTRAASWSPARDAVPLREPEPVPHRATTGSAPESQTAVGTSAQKAPEKVGRNSVPQWGFPRTGLLRFPPRDRLVPSVKLAPNPFLRSNEQLHQRERSPSAGQLGARPSGRAMSASVLPTSPPRQSTSVLGARPSEKAVGASASSASPEQTAGLLAARPSARAMGTSVMSPSPAGPSAAVLGAKAPQRAMGTSLMSAIPDEHSTSLFGTNRSGRAMGSSVMSTIPVERPSAAPFGITRMVSAPSYHTPVYHTPKTAPAVPYEASRASSLAYTNLASPTAAARAPIQVMQLGTSSFVPRGRGALDPSSPLKPDFRLMEGDRRVHAGLARFPYGTRAKSPDRYFAG